MYIDFIKEKNMKKVMNFLVALRDISKFNIRDVPDKWSSTGFEIILAHKIVIAFAK
jgi:hypothetical protein